jgi:hypothetical protein
LELKLGCSGTPRGELRHCVLDARVHFLELFRDTMVRLLNTPKMEFKELVEESA